MQNIRRSSSYTPSAVFPTELPPIDNRDAQQLSNGNHSWASKLWEAISPLLANGDSLDAIADKMLQSDKYLVDWIARQTEASFHNAVFCISRQRTQPLETALHWIYLASLVETRRFTPHSLFYLFHRALQRPMPKTGYRGIADDLMEQYPLLPFYLRFEDLGALQKEIRNFCKQIDKANKSELDDLLSIAYYVTIENSELFDLAWVLEEKEGRALQKCLERASPEYWTQFCPEGILDPHPRKHLEPSAAWKRLFHHLRNNAYFPTLDRDRERFLMSELSALSRDITYLDPRHRDGQQLRLLIEQTYSPETQELQFPKCHARLGDLQEKIDLCRRHFQPRKILDAYKDQTRDFHEIIQAKKQFACKRDAESFFKSHAKPIYQASAIYFFYAILTSDANLWPPKLYDTWRKAQDMYQVDLSRPNLTFPDYEQMIYAVWNQFSSENPQCGQMDLPDLLKRRIELLDADTLCKLYKEMSEEPNLLNRSHVLVNFFSEQGKHFDLNWFLEGFF